MNDACISCGMCCMTAGRPPFDFNRGDDRSAIPKDALAEIEGWVTSVRYQRLGPCPWFNLSTGRCNHYDIRPLACRRYEPGNDDCNAKRVAVKLPVIVMDESRRAGFADDADAARQIRAARQGGCCGSPTE